MTGVQTCALPICPKKNTNQIAKVLAYVGIGSLAFAGYEYAQANDKKTAGIVGVAGSLITIGAVCFWLLPHQPKYNFQARHLLEIAPLIQESK